MALCAAPAMLPRPAVFEQTTAGMRSTAMRNSGLPYNPLMPNRLWLLIALLLLPVLAGLPSCARDVNPPLQAVRYPAQVNIAFKTRGSFADGIWYYMVFNFTAAPDITAAKAPLDEISDKNRGHNWEMYIAYRREAGGQAQFLTLQRPNVPTVLVTKAGPIDAAVADFNSDDVNDILIACRNADTLQIILGKVTDVYNTTYFEDAVDIVASAGKRPVLVLTGAIDADTAPDMVVCYEGDTGTAPFLRVISSDGSGLFDQVGADLPLGGIPVDIKLLDLNGDTKLDLAVLTRDAATGQGTLRIFTGDGAGAFAAGATHALGLNPVALATGQLDAGTTLDFAVANRGSGDAAGTGSSVMTFTGAGDGTFTAGVVVPVPGPCEGVAIGKYFGSTDDISVTYIGKYKLTPTAAEQTGGLAAVYMNETDAPLTAATPPVLAPLSTNPPGVKPNGMLAMDTGREGNVDAIVLAGAPGSGGRLMYIQRGGRVTPAGSVIKEFAWEGDTISYITENEPSRIRPVDLNQDGVTDFVIPCVNGGVGDRICLYYGLGRSNYTSADIYWTDQQPELLAAQDWLLNPPIVGPNTIELQIDPFLFYDLGRQPPYVPDGFNVTFMTGTTGIDIQSNPNHVGDIQDWLSSPINVPMTPGFITDEQNAPRASQNVAPNPAEDIDNWRVEVI